MKFCYSDQKVKYLFSARKTATGVLVIWKQIIDHIKKKQLPNVTIQWNTLHTVMA